jgi:hypothetical protein
MLQACRSDGGRFPGRTFEAIRKRLERCSFVATRQKAFVETIQRAREEKLAAGIVEKDYALTWLLKGFYLMGSGLDDRLVLKGGTAIRKVYFPQAWRFSEDLDFTVAKAVAGDSSGNGNNGTVYV